jgi:hypothetical protein
MVSRATEEHRDGGITRRSSAVTVRRATQSARTLLLVFGVLAMAGGALVGSASPAGAGAPDQAPASADRPRFASVSTTTTTATTTTTTTTTTATTALQRDPTITLSPDTDLTNGQTMTVTGSGYPVDASLVAVECSPLTTAIAAGNGCDLAKADLGLVSSASGEISTKLAVYTGTVGSDAGAVCPPASGDCVVAIAEPAPSDRVLVSAPLAFEGQASPTPTTLPRIATRAAVLTLPAAPAATRAATTPTPTPSPAAPAAAAAAPGPALPDTGPSDSTWTLALMGAGLLDIGYLALSATWRRAGHLLADPVMPMP